MKKDRFSFNEIEANAMISIVGKTRKGKTFLAQKIAKKLGAKKLVVILDTKDEFKDIPHLKIKDLRKRETKGVYKLLTIKIGKNIIKNFYALSEFLAHNLFQRGNSILYIEEIGNVVGKQGRLYDIAPSFATFLQQGRGRNCGGIFVTQRPAEVHTTIFSESTNVFAFYMHSERDREALKHIFDPKLFDSLQQYEFLQYYDTPENKKEIKQHYRLYR